MSSMQSFPEGNWQMPRPDETMSVFHTSISLVNVPRVKRLSVSGGAIWFWIPPDPVLNRMFAFAKLRGAESIYRTKGGLMHGPVVKPIMRLSGLTTRQSISTPSSLSWGMRSVMSLH